VARVLVLNCGSSSLKYQLLDGDVTVARGLIERIGEPGGDAEDHETALRVALEGLDLTGLVVVGHRVVHGGTRFAAPVRVDDDVLDGVRDLIDLAPLHNPANLTGLEVARRLLPDTPHVAVFDTAFHQSMPPAASTYALDADLAGRYGLRRYGFHGTSHAYVARRTAEVLERPLESTNTITLHLGNGASACAVAGGVSVATSMGLTPLEGLVMGTRTGDLDPGVVLQLHRSAGLSVDEIDELLNHRGGLFGLCGANDMRQVLARRAAGDAAAMLAFDVYCRRIRAYVGSYAFLLGRVDAITFTAGVGENAAQVRAAALANLDTYGILVDPMLNESAERGARIISPHLSTVAVCVIPTNEELEIARESLRLVNGTPSLD
jgi:acetate kinase